MAISPHKLVKLRYFIQEFINPTEEEWQYLASTLELRNVPKKERLLQQGDICRHVAFVNKGLFRAYKSSDDKEITHYFPIEGFFATDYSSFINRTPSPDTIEALEDCEVLLLSRDDMHKAYSKYHVWERFGRLMAEYLYIKLEKTINSFQFMTPEERYLNLMAENPGIYERAPQVHIASFLGITPESLSRIRKRISVNNL